MEANPFFTEHAHAYTTSAGHAAGADLARLIRMVGARPGLVGLDVATGTGHTALAMARAGVRVTGVDPTPAMLAEARAYAARCACADMVDFVEGSAESIPFPDDCADIVTCRRAAHHFTDLAGSLREMARILRPNGRLGISDMCPPTAAARLLNRFERMRDPTHVRALDDAQWRDVVRAAGLDILCVETVQERMSLEEWLRPLPADGPVAAAVRSALSALDRQERASVTGGGEGRWLKRRILLLATK